MNKDSGFTLIEMIMAIVILGIVSGIVAVFISRPIQGYVDSANRAELTDMADMALKRMALEIRTAVPNTLRIGGGGSWVEFIPARGSGRYCTDTDTCANPLTHFGSGSSATVSFDILGPAPDVSTNDQIIIFNTGQDGLNAYSDNNCATATVVDADTLRIADTPFPYASPSSRFFVAPASGPIRFNCSTTAPLQLTRINGSATFCGQTPTAASALLVRATSLSCNFQYNAVSAANGLLTLSLTLGNAGGSVTLMNQIHVDNLP